ncbi:methyl-accepting chemotaxis protein [Paraburkholderia phenazinium]|uniref:Methyl-accepting chemotaxis protein n=1 Tax=Paraburkholderia phenazinium TaxID=60549 RepID=A0A1N6HBT7_9BURK|nr:methyl-accepting chemotaxis protein [Paraburkholderia phenazinium]SIO17223.1 methyl-accepting chemotaxis protein [Paraburkholderia phenazinium]
MPFLKNMRVVTQLVAGFALVILLLVGLGVFSLYEVSAENDHVAALRDKWAASVSSSLRMQNALNQMRLSEFRMASTDKAAEVQAVDSRMEPRIEAFRSASAEYEKLISEPEEKTAFADIQVLMPQYMDLDQQVRTAAKAGNPQQAMSILTGQSGTVRDAVAKDIDKIVAINEQGTAREGKAARDAYHAAIALVVGLIAAAAAVALAVALFIARGFARQLGGEPREAAAMASAIAAGNLRVTVPLKAGDNASLMYSLAAMKEQLTSIVSGIKSSSESISVAASEIAQGNTDLSQRTEEQAASLEETASSMEQLTSAVRQNADNAKQASTLATSGSSVAQRGGAEIGRVVATMHEIAESSARVAEIISVIEGIAFQTNILALNAAVEAARAGEQGRGFAVVAGEVRTLAQRSATAAKEIKDLITESVSRIDAGSKLVENAGRTMDEIVTSAGRTTDIMNELAAASEEQSTGIGQVNTAITQMDEVTQQNAALVEQASAAAQALAQQAQALRDAVSVFSVESDAPRAAVSARGASGASASSASPRRAQPVARSAKTPARATPRRTTVRAEPAGGSAPSTATAAAANEADNWQTF